MEKFTIEIQTPIGWTTYHTILRPGEERTRSILEELQSQNPSGKFRVGRWVGTVCP